MIVELMGRYAGWIALQAGIAGGADIIIIPEIPFHLDRVCQVINERLHSGRTSSILVVAEGAKPAGGDVAVKMVVDDSADSIRLGGIGDQIAADIRDKIHLETRVTVLGHVQRGGSPSAFDRILSTRFGVAAVELLAEGKFGRMVCLKSPNIDSDIHFLKKKIDAGAEYIVTQMFFDNNSYINFVEKCRKAGISVPIIPGLKPIAALSHLNYLSKTFSIDIPDLLVKEVLKCKDNNQVRKVGIEWAVQQSKELIKYGVPVLHYYTMGKPDNIRKIAERVF